MVRRRQDWRRPLRLWESKSLEKLDLSDINVSSSGAPALHQTPCTLRPHPTPYSLLPTPLYPTPWGPYIPYTKARQNSEKLLGAALWCCARLGGSRSAGFDDINDFRGRNVNDDCSHLPSTGSGAMGLELRAECVCVCLLPVRAKAKIRGNKYGATRSAGDYRRKVQLARLCALGGKDMV